MKTSSFIYSVVLFFFIISSLNAAAFRQMDSHTHGVAELNIVVEAQTVHIEFSSPAMNLAGFEHAARNEAEINTLKTIVAYLEQASWLQLKPQCKLQANSAQLHQEADDDHSEFTAQYRYLCESSQALESINVSLFSDYPQVHEIIVNLLTDNKQTTVELSHEQTILILNK